MAVPAAVPRWARGVAEGRPHTDLAVLAARAEAAAVELGDAELAGALAPHPRTGKRPEAGRGAAFSAAEQSGVVPDDAISARSKAGNLAYTRRIGRVFLGAAGRDGAEILAELERRLGNDEKAERAETVAQLCEIAVLRLNEVVGAMEEHARSDGLDGGVARPTRHDEKGSRR